jgi:hypothetical protein
MFLFIGKYNLENILLYNAQQTQKINFFPELWLKVIEMEKTETTDLYALL